MAITGQPLSGIDGSFFVNVGLADETEVTLMKWEFTPSTNVQNVPNFKGASFNEVLNGLRKGQIRCSCYWDAAQNPHQDPPDIRDGQWIQSVALVLNRVEFFPAEPPFADAATPPTVNNVLCIFCPWVLIETVPIRNDVEGKVEYEFTGHTDGPFYYPGDTIPTTAGDFVEPVPVPDGQ